MPSVAAFSALAHALVNGPHPELKEEEILAAAGPDQPTLAALFAGSPVRNWLVPGSAPNTYRIKPVGEE